MSVYTVTGLVTADGALEVVGVFPGGHVNHLAANTGGSSQRRTTWVDAGTPVQAAKLAFLTFSTGGDALIVGADAVEPGDLFVDSDGSHATVTDLHHTHDENEIESVRLVLAHAEAELTSVEFEPWAAINVVQTKPNCLGAQ